MFSSLFLLLLFLLLLLAAAEIKYMRRTAGYIWTDHKTNTETAKEINITVVLDKIQDYKRNWIHVNTMARNGLH
jgi:ABC-type ATPase involved in cell division